MGKSLYIFFAFTTFFVLNDARYPVELSLPPFELLAPLPLPENIPPYCVNFPPFAPQPPSTAVPTPPGYSRPPPSPSTPKFPIQSPPPRPPTHMPPPKPPGPPPQHQPSPPYHGPSPPKHAPTPPLHLPPTLCPPPGPPPLVPPPPRRKPQYAVWCVAKPTVPDAILQAALDYACGSGADCKSIQPNGQCFQPNTLLAHSSYAFNSYWQNAKVSGGTCDFGGTAMLVTADPSYNDCNFICN